MAGLIPRIDSQQAAREAVKMAGLPIFLIGYGTGMMHLFSLLQTGTPLANLTIRAVVFLAISYSLVLISRRMQRGKISLFPLACVLCIGCLSIACLTESLFSKPSLADPIQFLSLAFCS
jgi:hypothetical protein